MSEKPSLPLKVIRAVQIEEVRLLTLDARTRIRSAQELPKASVILEWTSRVRSRKGSVFSVVPSIRFKVVNERETAVVPAISLRASFELTYRLPRDFKPGHSELSAFAETNGIFNVWPYWRELIQTTMNRMGLPNITLPVYRIAEGLSQETARRQQAKSANKRS